MHKHDKQHSEFKINSEHDLKDYYYISYLFRSIYDDSIERWFSIFPREQSLYYSIKLFKNN